MIKKLAISASKRDNLFYYKTLQSSPDNPLTFFMFQIGLGYLFNPEYASNLIQSIKLQKARKRKL